jgi:hypothetical protein
VALEERARRVRAVDLEALVPGPVGRDEAEVVEQRTDVQQLGVVVQAEPIALQRAPEKDAPGVVEEQLGGDVGPALIGRVCPCVEAST